MPDIFQSTTPLIPPRQMYGTPEQRTKLGGAVVKAAEITAILAAVTKVVPGVPGKILGVFLAGIEKEPETGRLRPEIGVGANFLPSPFGFLDPTAVGLERNFYLPSGSTDYIPGVADRLGLGLPQQRAEDAVRSAQLADAASRSRAATAQRVVGGQSDEVLRDLAEQSAGAGRAGVLFGTSGVPAPLLADAAQAELQRRAAGADPFAIRSVLGAVYDNAGRVSPATNTVIGASTVAMSGSGVVPGGPTDPFGKPPPDASIQPEKIEPVNDAAKRNAAVAKGIRRELVSERADP